MVFRARCFGQAQMSEVIMSQPEVFQYLRQGFRCPGIRGRPNAGLGARTVVQGLAGPINLNP